MLAITCITERDAKQNHIMRDLAKKSYALNDVRRVTVERADRLKTSMITYKYRFHDFFFQKERPIKVSTELMWVTSVSRCYEQDGENDASPVFPWTPGFFGGEQKPTQVPEGLSDATSTCQLLLRILRLLLSEKG